MVGAFSVAYITGDGYRTLHSLAGYTAGVLVAIRIFWGFAGSSYARFSQFVKPASVVVAHLRDAMVGHDLRYVGHNPAGGAMIVSLLVCLVGISLSGWLLTIDAFFGSDMMDALHGWLSTLTLVLIIIHIAGVIFTSVRHRENLIWAMVTGRKHARPEESSTNLSGGEAETQRP